MSALTPIGTGGMGEGYKARDTRLDRTVAIKVLPEYIAKREDLRARFEREARAVASLSHPNICSLFDIGPGYMVMELIEAETLAARIEKGPIPLDQALKLAIQIADALDRAHRAGVTHRDVKPQNIMLTRDGVKVLDFGLAKSSSKPGPSEATLTAVLTTEGTVMGTPQYMTPEQFEGKEADARSDIWAFGAVLYEMVTGQKTFQGRSYTSLVGAILASEPAPMSVKPFTPAWLERLVRRCLAKDPEDRWQSMRDIVIELRTPPQESAAVGSSKAARWPWAVILPWAVAALFAIAAGFASWSARSGATAALAVERFSIGLPDADAVVPEEGHPILAISPDGSRLAYTCRQGDSTRLCMRPLDQLEIRPLAGTEGGTQPFFSPDSKWLGFVAGTKLKKIPADGGSPTVICDSGTLPMGPSWNPDNTITFGLGFTGGLAQVPADGGKADVFLKPDVAKNESSYLWPQVLRESILFTVGSDSIASFNEGQSFVAPRRGSGAKTLITGGGTYARYLPSGHLVYAYDGRLLAARFDLVQGKLQGPAIPVVEGVQMEPYNGSAKYSASQTGTLAYFPGRMQEARSRIAIVARNGSEEKQFELKLAAGEMRLSPDGRRLALNASKANDDIHILDLDSGTAPRFTYEAGDEQSPVWTPDGSRVAYASQQGAPASIWWKSADGSGAPKLLTKSENARCPSAISPDRKFLIFTENNPKTGNDLWLMPLEAGSAAQPRPWIQTPFDESASVFSPDGRWVAYTSNESGEQQVFVTQFPEGSVRRQISTSGGGEPLWAANGREIVYRKPKGPGEVIQVMAVDVATQPSFNSGSPHMLFEGKYQFRSSARGVEYAVMPDGRHLLLLKPPIEETPRQIQVVVNWFEELKRRVPAAGK